MSEHDFKKNLAMARLASQASTPVGQARLATKAAKEALSLPRYINWANDWVYLVAIFVGIIKDLLDFVGIGSLPAIGTAVTLCASIFIGLMMLLGGSGEKRKLADGVFKRYLLLIIGTILELLFGINLLPIESATIIVIYIMVLIERKHAAKSEKKQE